jgi:hypothetical protein
VINSLIMIKNSLLIALSLIFISSNAQTTLKSNEFKFYTNRQDSKLTFEFIKSESNGIKINFKDGAGNIFDDHRVVLWNKTSGVINEFINPFKKESTLLIPQALEKVLESNQYFIAILQNRNVIKEIDLFDLKNQSIQGNREKMESSRMFFAINDNVRKNSDLGKINLKIQIGESFWLKYKVINPKEDKVKIWFNSDQSGIRPSRDTILKNGKSFIDSIQFSTPFQYPKYGKKFKIKVFVQSIESQQIDSSMVDLEYDKLIPLELQQLPFDFENQIPEPANVTSLSISRFPEVLLSNSDMSVMFISESVLRITKKFSENRFSGNYSVTISSGRDSIQFKNASLKNDTFNLGNELLLAPLYFKLEYTKEDKYKGKTSVGIVLNPVEFTNSSSLGMPVGLTLGYRKKHGLNLYYLSNYHSLKSDFVFETENSPFPKQDFNKVNYRATNQYKYSLIEMGISGEFRLAKSYLLLLGARYSSFKYASVVVKSDLIQNTEVEQNIELLNQGFTSIDPLIGLNIQLSPKFSFQMSGSTRQLDTKRVSLNVGLNVQF